uniref:Cell differentiation protein rcd1 n=2 Tax=Solanum lycopersicum TaxID=4081 RepID=A0A3Q7IBC8_SOLLC
MVDDTENISFLISTEIIPKCLCSMEMGCELSKTVATSIVQKILLDDVGLNYVCSISKSFFEVIQVLGNMVGAVAEQPSSRLLKHIIRCYLRLSDNPRACQALKIFLPNMLRDNTFSSCLREDSMARSWLLQLLLNVNENQVAPQDGGGFDHMPTVPYIHIRNTCNHRKIAAGNRRTIADVDRLPSSPEEEIRNTATSVGAMLQLLKYRFRNTKLLEEALTHSSNTEKLARVAVRHGLYNYHSAATRQSSMKRVEKEIGPALDRRFICSVQIGIAEGMLL